MRNRAMAMFLGLALLLTPLAGMAQQGTYTGIPFGPALPGTCNPASNTSSPFFFLTTASGANGPGLYSATTNPAGTCVWALGEGYPYAVATLVSTAQTATTTITTLCGATATACGNVGQYHVHWDFWGSGTACSNVTAGSVTFALTWTDEQGSAHSAVPLAMFDQAAGAMAEAFGFNTALTTESAGGDYTFSTNGAAAVQYTATYVACTTGTGTYNLRATVTRAQ